MMRFWLMIVVPPDSQRPGGHLEATLISVERLQAIYVHASEIYSYLLSLAISDGHGLSVDLPVDQGRVECHASLHHGTLVLLILEDEGDLRD